MEEPDLEGSDQDDEPLIEETDDVLDEQLLNAEARLKQLEFEESKDADLDASLLSGGDLSGTHRFGSNSQLGDSVLESEKPDEYNWKFEDVADLTAASPDAYIVNVDSVNERCFILFSDLKLTEFNLQTKEVV